MITNLLRIVEAVVATVKQKCQLLVPMTLNEFVIIPIQHRSPRNVLKTF